MKIIKSLAFGALTAALVSCGTGTAPAIHDFEIETELPQKSLIDSVSYYIGFNFGYFIKNNGFNQDFVNMSEVKEGMYDYFKATGPNDTTAFKLDPKDINPTFRKYLGIMTAYDNEVNLKEGEKFLEANREKEGVEETESGLQYKIIEEGSELRPTSPKDTVEVIYRGTFINGEEFDSSKGKSVTMPLQVFIDGWKEGLPKIGEGGRMELYIPSELAYGSSRRGPIPGNSTLIFDIELIKVMPYVETENDKAPMQTKTVAKPAPKAKTAKLAK